MLSPKPIRDSPLLAAIPLLITALCYFNAAWGAAASGNRDWLVLGFRLEFLVIHSFPFIYIVAGLGRQASTWGWRWLPFGGTLALYVALALKMGGPAALLLFSSLTFATYFGFMLKTQSETTIVQLVVRWIFSFIAFMASVGVHRLPESVEQWSGTSALRAGAWYFLALGLLEARGVYSHPTILRVADEIRKNAKKGAP